MGELANSLKREGFERTERESPFHDDGTLWANSHELVCDETGIVVSSDDELKNEEKSIAELAAGRPRYSNSRKPILPGGFSAAYHWGSDGDEFVYDAA